MYWHYWFGNIFLCFNDLVWRVELL